MVKSQRDPKLDPQPGDLFRGKGPDGTPRYVRVHWRHEYSIGFAKADELEGECDLQQMPLDSFIEQVQAAEVVDVGDGTVTTKDEANA